MTESRRRRDQFGNEVKLRECLRCSREFKSLGRENRICQRCKKDEVFTLAHSERGEINIGLQSTGEVL